MSTNSKLPSVASTRKIDSGVFTLVSGADASDHGKPVEGSQPPRVCYSSSSMESLSALVVPTEKPPTDVDFKRAMLLFDQVHVFDPSDRELFAPHLWMQAIGSPIPMLHMNMGPILPLGKLPRYDESFAEAIESCAAARSEGVLVVEQAPEPSPGFAIGSVPSTPGRGHPRPILQVLRFLASNRDYLTDVCEGVSGDTLTRVDPGMLAPGGNALKVQGPPLADIQDGSLPNDQAETLRLLAAARIGSLVKCMDSSELRGLHLYSTDSGIHAAVSRMSSTAALTLAGLLGDDERRLVQRAVRVERVLADMTLPDATLGAMSVKKILKRRTKAWGRFGEARDAFFRHVRVLSQECTTDEAFDGRVKAELKTYYRSAGELNDEWKKWGLRVGAKATAASAVASGNVCEQLLGLESWSALAAISAVAAARLIEKEGPALIELWRKTTQNRIGAGRALAMPYSTIPAQPR